MTAGTEVSHFVCSLNLRDSPDAPDNGLPRLAILRSSEARHRTVIACVLWAEENVLCASETSVPSNQTTRCHSPDDYNRNFPRCEKLKT